MPSPPSDPAGKPRAGQAEPLVYHVARDLFFGVRLAEGLARLQIDARPFPATPDSAALGDAALALVDLSVPDGHWQACLTAARTAGVPVLAFGSHMDQERWQLARSLGATRVVANSQLLARFPQLVRRLMRPVQPQGSSTAGTLGA